MSSSDSRDSSRDRLFPPTGATGTTSDSTPSHIDRTPPAQPTEPSLHVTGEARGKTHIPYNPQQPNDEEEDRELHDDVGRSKLEEEGTND